MGLAIELIELEQEGTLIKVYTEIRITLLKCSF